MLGLVVLVLAVSGASQWWGGRLEWCLGRAAYRLIHLVTPHAQGSGVEGP
jgi:hypothetical protein